jgi:hypothetical protein
MSEETIEKRAYPHPTVRADWLAKVREDIIEPESPIIDPHHHLWLRLNEGSNYCVENEGLTRPLYKPATTHENRDVQR